MDRHKQLMREWQQRNREKRTEYFKKYRATKKGKEAHLRAILKYKAKNPDRVRAWSLSQTLPMKPCKICGAKAHKHHPDPLLPQLVEYLCPLHHKEEHTRINLAL